MLRAVVNKVPKEVVKGTVQQLAHPAQVCGASQALSRKFLPTYTIQISNCCGVPYRRCRRRRDVCQVVRPAAEYRHTGAAGRLHTVWCSFAGVFRLAGDAQEVIGSCRGMLPPALPLTLRCSGACAGSRHAVVVYQLPAACPAGTAGSILPPP